MIYKKMKYNKLVRDNIPEILKNKGVESVIHFADNEEYWIKLKEKLQEEVDEFVKDNNEEELADILEVIYAICDYKNFDLSNIEKIRKDKLEKRGGFKKKIILEES